MKKGTILKNIEIKKIGYHGIGISNDENGKKIIISGGVLPNSIVDCKIIKNKKDYIECQILRINSIGKNIKVSDKICYHNFFDNDGNIKSESHDIGCGGCKWQIIDYHQQLQLKKDIVKDSFRGIEGIKSILDGMEIVGSPLILGYRNKIEYSFGKYLVLDKDNEDKKEKKFKICENWNIGFHKQGEFSKVIDIKNCLLVSSKVNEIYTYLKKLFYDSGLPVYDQKIHRGFFRHLVVRQGVNTDQILVNLSVSDKYFIENNEGSKKSSWDKLKNKLISDDYLKKNITTFVINYNNGLADIVKSQDSKIEILIGDGYIYEKLLFEKYNKSLSFRVSAFSFFQTNTLGAQLLFLNAYEMLGNTKGDLLDLYCGTGTIGISFFSLGNFDRLFGIDIVDSSIHDAIYNSSINGLSKFTKYIVGKAEDILIEKKGELQDYNIGTIVVDPPRQGLHKNVLDTIIYLKQQKDFKLLYISCNPVTMARDIEYLIKYGFNLVCLKAVDMFPGTHHIETIGLIK